MKKIISFLIILILASAVFSCASGDTALVTIDTGLRGQAQVSLLDRFLSWITFSSALHADPVPSETINYIQLEVSAPDMDTISVRIPPETGKISLEIPAGMQRKFEVRAGEEYIGEGINISYGGISYADLTAGQDTNINIEIGNLPFGVEIDFYYYQRITYTDTNYDNSWETLTIVEFMESIQEKGPYTLIAIYPKSAFIHDGGGMYYVSYQQSLLKGSYWYKVKAYNKYGWYEVVSQYY